LPAQYSGTRHTAVCTPQYGGAVFLFRNIGKQHKGNPHMTIKIGDRLPEGKLSEFIETATEGCALGPNAFNVSDLRAMSNMLPISRPKVSTKSGASRLTMHS
jgi:hypothetical protein